MNWQVGFTRQDGTEPTEDEIRAAVLTRRGLSLVEQVDGAVWLATLDPVDAETLQDEGYLSVQVGDLTMIGEMP